MLRPTSQIARLLGRRQPQRCLACGREVEPGDNVARVRGAAFHERCATYRRPRHRRR